MALRRSLPFETQKDIVIDATGFYKVAKYESFTREYGTSLGPLEDESVKTLTDRYWENLVLWTRLESFVVFQKVLISS